MYFNIQDTVEHPYQPLEPTQAPINPPYQTACTLKRTNQQHQSGLEEHDHTSDTKLVQKDKTEEHPDTTT